MQEFQEHKIDWDDDKVQRLWNYYSKTHPYNSNYFSEANGGHVIKLFLDNNEALDNPTIVDFGGGKGFMFEHCKEQIDQFKYYNVDFSKESTIFAQERLEHHKEYESSIHIESLPVDLADNCADIVFLIEVLEHLNDEYLESTLLEIHRILKPNAILVLTTPNNEQLELLNNFCPDCGCIYHKWQHVRNVNKDNIKVILDRYAFVDTRVFQTTFNKPNSKVRRLYESIKNIFKKPKYLNLVCTTRKI